MSRHRTVIPNISVNEIEDFMRNQWTRYYSDSRSGLRLEFNGLGELRVLRRAEISRDTDEILWQGTDIHEARLALIEAM